MPSATRAGTIRSLEFFSASRRASARPFFIRPERQPPAGLFAGRHAEGVFISGQRPDIVRRLVDSVRSEAQAAGRDPRSVKFLRS
jgi:alkanesulfonate monooxygenase SsuD/methylene tetrahydromethanopterin reductase-like flavin-dependent oxidoreductase (luciferase family)